jgi:hypothetical protein
MSHSSSSPVKTEASTSVKGSKSAYDFHYENEQISREMMIAQATTTLLREELGECVRREGLNANVNCYDLRKKYFDLIKDRYKGMLFPEGHEPENRARPFIVYIPPKDGEN